MLVGTDSAYSQSGLLDGKFFAPLFGIDNKTLDRLNLDGPEAETLRAAANQMGSVMRELEEALDVDCYPLVSDQPIDCALVGDVTCDGSVDIQGNQCTCGEAKAILQHCRENAEMPVLSTQFMGEESLRGSAHVCTDRNTDVYDACNGHLTTLEMIQRANGILMTRTNVRLLYDYVTSVDKAGPKQFIAMTREGVRVESKTVVFANGGNKEALDLSKSNLNFCDGMTTYGYGSFVQNSFTQEPGIDLFLKIDSPQVSVAASPQALDFDSPIFAWAPENERTSETVFGYMMAYAEDNEELIDDFIEKEKPCTTSGRDCNGKPICPSRLTVDDNELQLIFAQLDMDNDYVLSFGEMDVGIGNDINAKKVFEKLDLDDNTATLTYSEFEAAIQRNDAGNVVQYVHRDLCLFQTTGNAKLNDDDDVSIVGSADKNVFRMLLKKGYQEGMGQSIGVGTVFICDSDSCSMTLNANAAHSAWSTAEDLDAALR